jgi:type IV pilus assembly protein PilA
MPLTRRPMADAECGNTLIELTMVMIVIAILMAVAIPTFLFQKNKAHGSSALSDARHAATYEESYFVGKGTYVGGDPATSLKSEGFYESAGTTHVMVYTYAPGTVQAGRINNGTGSYCIDATSASGAHVYVNGLTGTVSSSLSCPM